MSKEIAPLSGKIALVTGGAHPKGIGFAISTALKANGAEVFDCDLTPDTSDGCFACDVTKPDDVSKAVDVCLERYGRIDILVNNAGVGVGDPDFLKLSQQDWALSLGVNLLGIANMCQAAIPHMKSSGGSIINIASLAGLGAIADIPACYTASKFAAIGLTKALSLQFAECNIRVNAICPGSVVTQMHEMTLQNLSEEHGISLEEAQALEDSNIPLGRSASPEEIATTAVFLAGDQSKYMTGVALPVAGGMMPGL